MKRISKRVLAAVLTLCMLVSLMPMMASAAVRTDPRFSRAIPENGYNYHATGNNGYFDVFNYSANPAVYSDVDNSYTLSKTADGTANAGMRYYLKTTQREGTVELAFDIAFTTIENPRMESVIFSVGGNAALSIYGNELHLGGIGGNGQYLGTIANDADPETEETPIASGRVVLHFDFENQKLTGSYAGGATKTIDMPITSMSAVIFELRPTIMSSSAGDVLSDISYKLTNMNIALVACGATPIASCEQDTAKGIGLNDAIIVSYDGTIDATGNNLEGVTVTKADGSSVAINKRVAGTNLVVTPATAWDQTTSYTLNVAADSIKVYGTGNAAATYTFNTGKLGNPNKLNFVPDWSNLSTAADLITWLKTDSNYNSPENYRLWSSYLQINGTTVENATTAASAPTATDYITVENGVLHFKSTNTQQLLRLQLSDGKTFNDGYLKVSFKVGFNSMSASPDCQFFYINGLQLALTWPRNSHAAMRIGGADNILLNPGTTTASNAYPTMHDIEVLANLTTGELRYSIDGATKRQTNNSGTTENNDAQSLSYIRSTPSFNQIYWQLPKGTGITDMYISNLSIVNLDATEMTASVTEGAENVSKVAPISASVNALLPDSYWEGVTLVPTEGGNSAEITVTPDASGYGAKIQLDSALEPGEEYTLTFPAYTGEFTEVPMAAKTITFTTSTADETLYVSDYTIPAVAAGRTMEASATFGYAGSGSQSVMVGFALYASDDSLLKAAYTEYTFTEAGSQTVRANFTAPAELAAGAYVKVFAWKGGVAAMQPICAPLS